MKKRLLALLLAATMTMGMTMTTFAEEGKYSITINQIKGATETHTYEAYQIFKGTLVEKTEDGNTVRILSDITWGDNIDVNNGIEYNGTTYTDATQLAKALEGEKDAEAFAKAIASHITGEPKETATEENAGAGVELEGLEDGYYFVKDKDGSLKADSYSRYMIQVAGIDVKVTAKADVPSTEKKVKDKNDTTAEETDWQDSADYDIGDVIPFQFSSTIVENIDKYVKPYIYTFHDVESEGLTFNKESVKMTINGIDYTDFKVITADITDKKCTFEVVTGDLRRVAKAGDKVVVTYTATLNGDAVIGSAGNTNKMHLEFSNNPNGEGTGKTPEDTVIVFTYKVVVNKVSDTLVNGVNQPLVGAEFTLEKKVKDENGNDTWKFINCIELTEENVQTSTFTFKGIDDGDYRLKETKTPDGYNTISDEYVYFTVTAEHNVTADDPKLTSLSGVTENGLVGEYTFEIDKNDDDALKTTIENKSGSLLPSTGGMGTTIFYIIGGILVVGAGIVLFAKKRMSNEEE